MLTRHSHTHFVAVLSSRTGGKKGAKCGAGALKWSGEGGVGALYPLHFYTEENGLFIKLRMQQIPIEVNIW